MIESVNNSLINSRDGAASESQESVYELKADVDGNSMVFAPGDSMINFGG